SPAAARASTARAAPRRYAARIDSATLPHSQASVLISERWHSSKSVRAITSMASARICLAFTLALLGLLGGASNAPHTSPAGTPPNARRYPTSGSVAPEADHTTDRTRRGLGG